jgi:hypothetical protein
MSDAITSRLAELVKDGRELVDDLVDQQDDTWVDDGDVAIYESWLAASGQLLLNIEGPESASFGKFRQIINSQHNPVGVKTFVVRQVFDLMLGVFEEWSCGVLRRYEDIVAAPILDDLLDLAERYRADDRRAEASALACAVFEQALRRIAARNGISRSDKKLPALADEVARVDAIDDRAAGRLQRSVAVHENVREARWNDVADEDIAGLIADTRQLVQDHI